MSCHNWRQTKRATLMGRWSAGQLLQTVQIRTGYAQCILPDFTLYSWVYVLCTTYLLHVSALTEPSSGRTLITSKKPLLIVGLLQWLGYRALIYHMLVFLQSCLWLLKQYCPIYMVITIIYISSSCSWRVRRVSCSLILKMKLVSPSLHWLSNVPSSFWFIL